MSYIACAFVCSPSSPASYHHNHCASFIQLRFIVSAHSLSLRRLLLQASLFFTATRKPHPKMQHSKKQHAPRFCQYRAMLSLTRRDAPLCHAAGPSVSTEDLPSSLSAYAHPHPYPRPHPIHFDPSRRSRLTRNHPTVFAPTSHTYPSSQSPPLFHCTRTLFFKSFFSLPTHTINHLCPRP